MIERDKLGQFTPGGNPHAFKAGPEHPDWQGGVATKPVRRNCIQCGVLFVARNRASPTAHCSHACARQTNAENRREAPARPVAAKSKPPVFHSVFRQAIGEAVRDARLEQGLTLQALAEKSGITRQVISSIESGDGNPMMDFVGFVLDALELAVEVGACPTHSSR